MAVPDSLRHLLVSPLREGDRVEVQYGDVTAHGTVTAMAIGHTSIPVQLDGTDEIIQAPTAWTRKEGQ